MRQFLFIVAAAGVSAAAPRPAVEYAVKDKFIPAPYESQRIDGFLGERMRINLEQRLLRVDEPALLAGFQHRPGTHPWIGEHIGKFLHAGTNTWLYTHDPRLKTMLDRMARELIATQMADGYLGTYTEDQRWTSWDVWVHKYDLIGLLSYYEATGYGPALAASRRIGDLLVNMFGDEPGKRDLIAASTHVGMAASSILEPICYLSRWTGDKKYLDFARYIVRSWDQPNGPKIVKSLLETGSVYKTANAKAYEMMSCLVGLLELYRLTGEQSFFKAAENAWNDIMLRRLYLTGTTSSHEHFQDDYNLPGTQGDDVGEGCATVTWLQLNWHLLRLTGDFKYGRQLEKTIYNQLLAAQDPTNGNICYFTPLIGAKHATPGINCCVSSEPRGISMIPQIAWGTTDRGIAVLLYTPGRMAANGRELTVETDFPNTGRVAMTVNSAGNFCLDLRVPSWTDHFEVRSARKIMQGIPGSQVSVCRQWKTGDRVDIEMDMPVKVIEGAPTYPGLIAIQRGPQVLALDAGVNPGISSIHRAALKGYELKQVGAGQYDAAGVVLRGDGQKQESLLKLIPFTEARSYRVWLPKADALPDDPAPVTAYGNESASGWGRVRGSFTDERADTYRDTRDGKPREEDWFAVELTRPEQVRRIVYRHGRSEADGGWFAGTPRIQVKGADSAEWKTVGELTGYSGGPALAAGTAFELKLEQPLSITAVRVIGKAESFATCAELAAYAQ